MAGPWRKREQQMWHRDPETSDRPLDEPQKRRRGPQLPGPIIPVLVLVACAFLVAQLGGMSGSSGPKVGASANEEWINPGLSTPSGSNRDATARVLVRLRPQELPARRAVRAARSRLRADTIARPVALDDGSSWHALSLDEPLPMADIERSLDGTGVVTVMADPPRWPLEQPAKGARFGEQWALHSDGAVDVNAPQAWEVSHGSEDVVVAVIDSGVDANHPELRDVVLPGHNVTDVGGPNDTRDSSGHGTAVAAVIAAQGAVMNGLAPRIRILPIKVFAPDYFTTSADVAAAVDRAVDGGADIINLSLGCSPRGLDPTGICHSQVERAAIQRARDQGVLVVTAAGNSGTNNDELPSYPQNYEIDNILNVAASNRNGSLADWSNFGPQSVHVAAPGVGILVGLPGGKYALSDGTSFAAPLASGAAALAHLHAPELDAAGLRAAVMQAARPVPALEGRIAMAGVLDAEYAARGTVGTSRPVPPPGPDRYLAEHGDRPAVQPRSARLRGPARGTTVAPGGRPQLTWKLPASTDVYEVAISRSPRSLSTPAGAWLEDNGFGVSWAAARRLERYRPRPLSAGRYWWQVVTWDDVALQMTFSQIRSFTVPPKVSVRTARVRARGRALRAGVLVRANKGTTTLKVVVYDGGIRIGRRLVTVRQKRAALWAWQRQPVTVRTSRRLRPGTRLRVKITAVAGPATATVQQRVRIR